MSLRLKFIVYLAVVHLPFGALAVYVLQKNRPLLFGVEALFLVSFLAGLRLIRSLFGSLDLIRSGAQFIQESDFSSRFREVGQPELDQLVQIYNRMVGHLREERIRLQEQHYFLEKILQASPSGILTLDFDGKIAMINPSGESMLGIPARELLGNGLLETESPILRALAALQPGDSTVLPFWGSRRMKCRRSEFLDRGFTRPFFLLEELTEELRRSERAAYEKLIRMMSHEVNNSVGAASSLLETCLGYTAQIREEDRADYESALRVVMSRAAQLNTFMRAFSDVVRIPSPRPQPCDVLELLKGVVALFRAEAVRRRITWVWEIEGSSLASIPMDRGQFEQVLVNILKNAMEAIGEDGTITLRAGRRGGRARLVIEDTGAGIAPEVRDHLFTPFYSTKRNGQGIGLTIVREILSQHRFAYSLEGSPGQPTRFTIDF